MVENLGADCVQVRLARPGFKTGQVAPDVTFRTLEGQILKRLNPKPHMTLDVLNTKGPKLLFKDVGLARVKASRARICRVEPKAFF